MLAFVENANKKCWSAPDVWPKDFYPNDGKTFARTTSSRGSVELSVDLDEARKLLTRLLKPGRKTVDVVAFKDGTYEELSSTEVDQESFMKRMTKSIGLVGQSLKKLKEKVQKSGESAKAGATVALPVRGCPEPRLAQAELKAREVLFAFLDEEQKADFHERQAFVTYGEGTGHRYMITSRHARDTLSMTRRQLFDLDEKVPYCVHDFAVPAAEEMLSLHLLLKIPEYENYLRHLHWKKETDMFICIEGCDATGKTTLVNALILAMRGRWYNRLTLEISFPRYQTIIGQEIEAWLKDGRAINCPHAFQVLQTADKITGGEEIGRLLAQGNNVVSSRYWQSAYVYGGMSGVDTDMLMKMHEGIPMPDLNILLDMDVGEALKRRPEKRDAYERNPEFLEKVRKSYLDLWQTGQAPGKQHYETDWVIIDASQDAEIVLQKALEHIERHA